MLVLTRRPGESLRIGPDVRVTGVASSNGQVRLAIDAPQAVSIHREEVHERIASANLEAARDSGAVMAAWSKKGRASAAPHPEGEVKDVG